MRSPYRCQICGRRKGLRKNGTIVYHHVRGLPCAGAGAVPIEENDDRLRQVARETEGALRSARATIRALEARRANWIDPSLLKRRDDLRTRLDTLHRRIKRLDGWADLADRQMARYGWCQRPPAYLLARQVQR
ncbi:hypothetical protein U1872_12330 [Sphingomonas sp. RB3P16]|uniref:hypothetical protein n=1 Tax=Parasphingomonas frigoris TaxID=3096163 RepID=UPI002FCAB39D